MPMTFQFLTAVSMMIRTFWNVVLFSLVGVDQRFRVA